MRPLDPLGKPYSIRLYRISTSGSCATAFSHAHLAEGDNYQIPNGQGVDGKKNLSQGSIKSDMEGSASRLPRTTFQMNTHRLIIRLSAFPQPDKMFRFQFYLVSCSKLPLLKESSRLSRDKYSLLYQPFIIFHYAFLSILNTCKQRFS
jgi:hypothetical protein